MTDSLLLANCLKKLQTASPECKHYFDEILEKCNALFFIPDPTTFPTKPGIINKIFYCLEFLKSIEPSLSSGFKQMKLYLEIKEKIRQTKFELSIMKNRMSPYDKINPEFCAPSFVKEMKLLTKKLNKPLKALLENNINDPVILKFLKEKQSSLIEIIGKKTLKDLLDK